MRALLQRVSRASVTIGEKEHAAIAGGLVILLGVRSGDTGAGAEELAGRCARLRIFEDDAGRMNRSLVDTGGEALVISQFTLFADTRKGNRPGFSLAAPPDVAEPLYERFVQALRGAIGATNVKTGVFRAMMDVELVNAGPVTIMLEERGGGQGQ